MCSLLLFFLAHVKNLIKTTKKKEIWNKNERFLWVWKSLKKQKVFFHSIFGFFFFLRVFSLKSFRLHSRKVLKIYWFWVVLISLGRTWKISSSSPLTFNKYNKKKLQIRTCYKNLVTYVRFVLRWVTLSLSLPTTFTRIYQNRALIYSRQAKRFHFPSRRVEFLLFCICVKHLP